jgi:hypothetical protein
MIHIIDNVFGEEQFIEAQRWSYSLPDCDVWQYKEQLNRFAFHLFHIAEKYIDLSDTIGCEMHLNHKTPGLHSDKDEYAYFNLGQLIFPLCGIVWYSHIDMTGGEILFPEKGVVVKPITNRMIVFSGDLLHDGNPFKGIRKSVGMNPWSTVPMGYK